MKGSPKPTKQSTMVKHLPDKTDTGNKSEGTNEKREGGLEFGGKRTLLMDVAGGLYALKKTLKADIGFFERDFMFRAGEEGAKSYLSDVEKSLRDKSSHEAIEMMLGLYSQRGYGEFKLRRLDKEHMIAEIASSNTVEAWAFKMNLDMQREPVCSYSSGMLSMICRLAFSREPSADLDFSAIEVECMAQGNEECKFIIGPIQELPRYVPSHSLPKDSVSEHVLRFNEEILLKNLELQSLNLSLERQMRKRTEDLRRSEENYKRLIELSPDPIIISTVEGTVSSINDSGLRLLGYDSSLDIEGIDLTKIFADGARAWEKLIWQLEKEGAVHNLECELLRKNGAKIVGEVSARFADLIPGRCVESMIRDVTEKKMIHAQMVEAKSESEFLNDLLSHDITNYAVSALYYLENVRKSENLSDLDRRNLAIVLKDVQGAFELSTSVRDLSRIKSMREEDAEVKELQQLIAEGVEEARRLFSEKKVRVAFERSAEPMFIRGNAVVSRLFTNILTNAVKFDSNDEVVVDITVESEVDKGIAYWRVNIVDRGKGIPDLEKTRIFDRFFRGDSSMPGTGLGLFVVKFITDSCGGKVWAENRVAGDHTKGTKMVVLLQKATHRQVAEVSKLK